MIWGSFFLILTDGEDKDLPMKCCNGTYVEWKTTMMSSKHLTKRDKYKISVKDLAYLALFFIYDDLVVISWQKLSLGQQGRDKKYDDFAAKNRNLEAQEKGLAKKNDNQHTSIQLLITDVPLIQSNAMT
ncbi:hypothetical protein QYF36_001431 [Acer negundo]|nr:hypothetical protein QYF36_001431 [Acer negundo]